MSRVVVCGVLHPQNIKYFPEFINNLNAQTFKKFDLLIINERIEESLLNVNFKKGELLIRNSLYNDPKKNRDLMFESLRRLKYEVNILTDLDDLMSNDRVYESFISIKENKSDICYNDIVPFSDEKKISINNRFWSEREDFKNQKPNIKYNLFGLGNTAISSRVASFDINVSDNTVYDWEYFLKVFSLSKCVISKSNGYTFYRQINNTLGISQPDQKTIDQLKN